MVIQKFMLYFWKPNVKKFLAAFTLWFFVLLLFFLAANLTGLIRDPGLLPFRSTGFPFTFAVWGYSVEEFFNWNTLFLNGFIAFVFSFFGAALLAWHRCRFQIQG